MKKLEDENIKDVLVNDSELLSMDEADLYGDILDDTPKTIDKSDEKDTNTKSNSKKNTKESTDEPELDIDEIDKLGEPENTKKSTKNGDIENPELDYKELALKAKKSGVFTIPIPEDFDGSEESFIKLTDDEIVSNVVSYRETLDEQTGGLISFVEAGGDIRDWKKVQNEFNYDSLTDRNVIGNEALQEKIVFENHLLRGYSEAQARTKVEKAKNREELEDEALEILPDLQDLSKKEKEKLKQVTQEKRNTTIQQIHEFNNNIYKEVDKLDEVFPGLKIDSKKKAELKKIYDSGRIQENMEKDPITYTKNLLILDYLGLLKGDWSKVINTATTTASKSIKNTIIKSGNKGGESQHRNEEKSGTSDILDSFAKLMKK